MQKFKKTLKFQKKKNARLYSKYQNFKKLRGLYKFITKTNDMLNF